MRRRSQPHRNMLVVLAVLAAGAARAGLPPAPEPAENPITADKALLGKILFWEEQLSSDNTVACGTCHRPAVGGADPRPVAGARHPGADGLFDTEDDVAGSMGVVRSNESGAYQPDPSFGFEPQVTRRLAPSFIGAQFSPELFWDGRGSGTFIDPDSGAVSIAAGGALESQAALPPLSDVEMAHAGRDWGDVVGRLTQVKPMALATKLPSDLVRALERAPTYSDLFQRAFGDPEISAERIAFAVATYQRTLVSDQTPFDLGTMTPEQQSGWIVFAQNCTVCHMPPHLTDFDFHNIGVRPVEDDPGRMEVTGNPGDAGRFKTPGLRNVGLRPRFFHDGSLSDLNQVIRFYNAGGHFADNLDPMIFPMQLTAEDRAGLISFLTGALTDPRVELELSPFDRPTLHSESSQPRPTIVGVPSTGSGGFAPRMLALSPALAGKPGFKIGVADGLGGAQAALVVGSRLTRARDRVDRTVDAEILIVALDGSGPGAGYATQFLELPVRWKSRVLFAQWLVVDPQAEGGVAHSAIAALPPLGATVQPGRGRPPARAFNRLRRR